MNKKIGVVMPVTVHFDMAVRALASIKSDFHMWSPFIYIQGEDDISLSAVWNWGIKKAFSHNYDYALVINDDVLFAPYTLDALIEGMQELDFTSAFNYRSEVDPPEEIVNLFPQPKDGLTGLDFSCFMISHKAFLEVGPFDEKFYPIYFEDNDYAYRMLLHGGIKFAGLAQAAYYHYGSSTHKELVRQQGTARAHFFVKNRQRYLDKWGGPPGAEIYKTPFDRKPMVR